MDRFLPRRIADRQDKCEPQREDKRANRSLKLRCFLELNVASNLFPGAVVNRGRDSTSVDDR
jgi:hypothetical protein